MFIVRAGAAEFLRLTIDCAQSETGNPASPSPAIWRPADAPGAVDVAVFECRIRNAHDDGIRIQGGSGNDRPADRVIVRDTTVEGCGMNGLSIGRVDNIRIESSRFERCHNGIKVLDKNDVDIRHQESDVGQPLTEVKIHGLHGSLNPEGHVKAEPGTLYEWHDADQGGAYVKAAGVETRGWKRVTVE